MTISEIRTKYTSAGDIIFRTAIGWLTEGGTDTAKSEKPDKLEMIEDYVKACAADIAESPEFGSRIADAFRTDKKMVYLVYYESDRVVKEVQSIHKTFESAMKAYTDIRKQILEDNDIDDMKVEEDYDIDGMKVEEDKSSISIHDSMWNTYDAAYISAEEVEE